MLPDFRFVIGAILAIAVLSIAAFGLTTAVRLSHEAKVGPPEATRSLAFDERADWNQFSDPELARRFDVLARQSEAGPAMPVPDAVAAVEVPQAVLAVPAAEASIPEESSRDISLDSATDALVTEDKEPLTPDVGANLKPQPLIESEPAATIAPATASQEPVVPGAIAAKPVEPRAVLAETIAPADVAASITEPAPVDAPPVAAERATNVVAPSEVEPAGIERTAALPVPQLRTPSPRPRAKQALAKRPVKAKVAKAKAAKAKPKPRRTAAQQPAAPAAPAAQPFGFFGGGLFRQ